MLKSEVKVGQRVRIRDAGPNHQFDNGEVLTVSRIEGSSGDLVYFEEKGGNNALFAERLDPYDEPKFKLGERVQPIGSPEDAFVVDTIVPSKYPENGPHWFNNGWWTNELEAATFTVPTPAATIRDFEGEIFGVAHHLLDDTSADKETVVLMVANLLGYTQDWVAGRLDVKL
jgi:hypothetical protein